MLLKGQKTHYRNGRLIQRKPTLTRIRVWEICTLAHDEKVRFYTRKTLTYAVLERNLHFSRTLGVELHF